MTGNPKVHRYKLSREQIQGQVILAMWLELRKPPHQQDPAGLDTAIRAQGHAWALPTMATPDNDTLLTTTQIADLTGYTESTIRSWTHRNHIHRHPDGRYRWADIYNHIHRQRTPKLTPPNTACNTFGHLQAAQKRATPAEQAARDA